MIFFDPTVKQLLREDNTSSQHDDNARNSTLLAYGTAMNIQDSRVTTRNQRHILATATGEAGQVLRLTRPREDGLGWEGYNDTKLSYSDISNGEHGFWVGNGGTIRQITFAADTEGPTSWLAIRQVGETTIFRPLYRESPVSATVPQGQAIRYPPSRLQANAIFTLPVEKTGNSPQVDISFNPWYVRQLVVLDQRGYWTIWDIEGQKRKRATFDLKPGKNGFILDDFIPEPGGLFPDNGDGWGRALWCGGVSTLVACSRRHLAVFDLQSRPRRLYSPELFKNGVGWILDIKRNPASLNQVVVLTSSRIFWIVINPAGVENTGDRGDGGARIILSRRHFRDQEDDSLRLELHADGNGKLTGTSILLQC
jgi:RNA polymerase I-specific transcription initiation factor RRN6